MRMLDSTKQSVRDYWDAEPCGTGTVPIAPGSREFFDAMERHRYTVEPFIRPFANFQHWAGKTMLEIGCGAGTDHLQFARAGARACAVDVSSQSVALTRRRLAAYGFGAERVLVGDAEHLPFSSSSFDLVYSWGVLHHSPDTPRTVREVYRVLRPGGDVRIMLYHRFSLVSLQFYLKYGLFRGQPFRSINAIMAAHQESPGTKVYSCAEVRQMFGGFEAVTVSPVLTPYDLRSGRKPFLPKWAGHFLPNGLGYFLLMSGRKPA
ncbi:MAG TPA: class I SAM-dependent methyltransferase [Vicinamibacterales bacterium]|nr:class I SAM-dependent methyltransferase [Vicinamibacterales bacterium]